MPSVVAMQMGGDADAGMAWRLARLMRAERPDVVHLHSRRGADLWGGIAARLTGTPCVLSRRVDNPEPRWLVALKYRLFDHIITISEGIRAGVAVGRTVAAEGELRAQRGRRDTLSGEPVDAARLSREFDLPASSRVIGVVAQMIPRKGHRYVIDAVDAATIASGPARAVLRPGAAAR
jgi:glycosyltransferase involved in cell wall biosynthesis